MSCLQMFRRGCSGKRLSHKKKILMLLGRLVKVPTRANRTLDVFIINCPFLWKPGFLMKRIVRSDHLAIIVHPSAPVKTQQEKDQL